MAGPSPVAPETSPLARAAAASPSGAETRPAPSVGHAATMTPWGAIRPDRTALQALVRARGPSDPRVAPVGSRRSRTSVPRDGGMPVPALRGRSDPFASPAGTEAFRGGGPGAIVRLDDTGSRARRRVARSDPRPPVGDRARIDAARGAPPRASAFGLRRRGARGRHAPGRAPGAVGDRRCARGRKGHADGTAPDHGAVVALDPDAGRGGLVRSRGPIVLEGHAHDPVAGRAGAVPRPPGATKASPAAASASETAVARRLPIFSFLPGPGR